MATASKELAVKRSWVRVLILTLISFGLYYIYWFFITRRLVFKEEGKQGSAGLHTLGLFVPILNWYVIYWLIKDIATISVKEGAREVSIPLLTLLSIFVSVVGHVLVQDALNSYWDKKTDGAATEARYTAGEIITSLLGIVLFLAFFALIIFGAVTGAGSSSTDSINRPTTNY